MARKFFEVTYHTVDPNNVTETEKWYVQAENAASARKAFRDAVELGDEEVWGISMDSRPESSGPDEFYVVELGEYYDEDGSGELDTTMLQIGAVRRVAAIEVDDDRLFSVE